MKKIGLAALLVIGMCGLGSRTIVAQNPSAQGTATADQTAGVLTDQQLALLRKDIRSIKKQLIATNLDLTDTEATRFWPVYEQYSADLGKINETRVAIVKEYSEAFGSLTDVQADSRIGRWLETDIAAQLRRKYVPVVQRVLPSKKAVTFFQLDRRISMMIDVQLASQLPLVQSQE